MTRSRASYYATQRGSRYHSDPQCNGLNGREAVHALAAPPKVTAAQIRRRGLQPCLTCRPSPMLTLIPGGNDGP